MKEVQKKFLKFLDDTNIQTLDQLVALPNFKKLLDPVLVYNKMLLSKLGQQFSNKIGVFHEWKDQIPNLTRLAHLIITK